MNIEQALKLKAGDTVHTDEGDRARVVRISGAPTVCKTLAGVPYIWLEVAMSGGVALVQSHKLVTP